MSDGEKRKLPALYGTWANEDRVVGYCLRHRAYVTVTQMKEKECLRKNCRAFRRRAHPLWEQRKRSKEIRRRKREEGIPPWERVEPKKSES